MKDSYFVIIQIYFILYIILTSAITCYLIVRYVKNVKADLYKYVECVLRTNKERNIPLDSHNVVIPNPDKVIKKNKKPQFYHYKKDVVKEMAGDSDDAFD